MGEPMNCLSRIGQSGIALMSLCLASQAAFAAHPGSEMQPRAATAPFVYFLPPPRYRVIAKLNASGYGLNSSLQTDQRVLMRLRRHAAHLGANAVLMRQVCGSLQCGGSRRARDGSYRALAIQVPGAPCPYPAKICDWLEPSGDVAARAAGSNSAIRIENYTSSGGIAITTARLGDRVKEKSVGQVRQTKIVCPPALLQLDVGEGFPVRLIGRVDRSGRVSAVRIVQTAADPPVGARLASDLRGAVKQWRFTPLRWHGKNQGFDIVMVMRRVDHAHANNRPYICSPMFAPRRKMPNWYLFRSSGSHDARLLAAGVAAHRQP